MIWVERGGHGERCFVLLHGLGATGAVWKGLVALIDASGLGRHVVVDLPGHGGSDPAECYDIDAIASSLAPALEDTEQPIIIGHSLGAYVALALARGESKLNPSGVLAIGPKIGWSAVDMTAIKELAAKPARLFATEREAVTRYRKVSGLDERIAATAATLERGVRRNSDGWQLACDPRTALAGGSASFAALSREARCPFTLARGEHDPLVRLEELRELSAKAENIPDCGHNAHVESPGSVIPLIRKVTIA